MNLIKKTLCLLFPLLVCASAAQGQVLTITTNATLPNVVVAEAMNPFQLEASGGTLPYTWSLVTGSQALVGKLATGLSVTPDGRIVGAPTALQAPVGFTVQVADSSSPKKNHQESADHRSCIGHTQNFSGSDGSWHGWVGILVEL